MGYGDKVDGIFGKLAHVLHVRGTRNDTSRDLERYLDRPLDELFPEPSLPAVARRAPGLLDDPRMEALAWRSGHVPLSDAYKARHEGEYSKNLTAHATWMHPKGTRRRSILLYAHIWLQTTPRFEEALALPLFSKTMDVDVALIQLPFHGRRNAKGQLFGGEWFWSADLVRSLEAVRQSVYDVRAAMAYFRSLGYEEVGVAGISLGGSIAMLTACLDPVPDYIIPIIAHLELVEAIEEAEILWRMKADLERFGLDRDARRALFTRLALHDTKPKLAPERQLWLAAREDRFLTERGVLAQWERWGRPGIEWLSGGHMTFMFDAAKMLDRMKAMPKLAGGPIR